MYGPDVNWLDPTGDTAVRLAILSTPIVGGDTMFIGFREIREIKTEEKNLVRNQNESEIDITKAVKPESMTFDEAQAFWDNFWKDMNNQHE